MVAKPHIALLALLALLCFSLHACGPGTLENENQEPEEPSNSTEAPHCEPLASESCFCDDELDGIRTCDDEGQAFGECVCEDPDEPDPEPTCAPHSAHLCYCDESPGVQFCDEAGSEFGACDCSGTVYFVSATGDDEAAGTDPDAPWQTLERLQEGSFAAGDVIFFERGSVWSLSTLRVPASNLVLGAYGEGPRPRIEGFLTLEDWQDTGDGIWSVTDERFPDDLRLVTFDGAVQPKGRYPEEGWLLTTAASGNSSISTDQGLQGTPDFTGGEIVVAKNSWVMDRGTITGHSGQTLYYTGTSNYDAATGLGFFVQNHRATLSRPGDWAYDQSSRTLHMYFGASGPAGHQVQAAVVDTLLELRNVSEVHVDSLVITGGHQDTVLLNNAPQNALRHLEILKSGFNALRHESDGGPSDDNLIEYNLIEDTFNQAIEANRATRGATVRHNTIRRTFQIPGTAANGDLTATAISAGAGQWRAGNHTIEHNRIYDSGYIAIYATGSNTAIRYNLVDGFCQTKIDGGGIYMWGGWDDYDDTPFTNRVISHNIVKNGGSADLPRRYGFDEDFGIYIDDRSRHVTIEHNTVTNAHAGLYLHNAGDLVIRHNRLYNNRGYQIFFSDDLAAGPDEPIDNLDFQHNHIYSGPDQTILRINTHHGVFDNFGTLDHNHYMRPSNEADIFLRMTNFGSAIRDSLESWQAALPYDANSVGSPTTSQQSRLLYNDTPEPQTHSLSGYIDVQGNPVTDLTLAPFESVILLGAE